MPGSEENAYIVCQAMYPGKKKHPVGWTLALSSDKVLVI